jgi:hypothetical protein
MPLAAGIKDAGGKKCKLKGFLILSLRCREADTMPLAAGIKDAGGKICKSIKRRRSRGTGRLVEGNDSRVLGREPAPEEPGGRGVKIRTDCRR